MIGSLDAGIDTVGIFEEMEKDGISFDFSNDFDEKVIGRVFNTKNEEIVEV